MSKVTDLHKKWNADPDYRAAYDELGREFALARSVIEARTRAGFACGSGCRFTRSLRSLKLSVFGF